MAKGKGGKSPFPKPGPPTGKGGTGKDKRLADNKPPGAKPGKKKGSK